MAASLAEPYEAQLQPDGSILMVLAGGVTRPLVEADYKSNALHILWWMRSMQVSRRKWRTFSHTLIAHYHGEMLCLGSTNLLSLPVVYFGDGGGRHHAKCHL